MIQPIPRASLLQMATANAKEESLWDPEHDWILKFERLLSPNHHRRRLSSTAKGETKFFWRLQIINLGVVVVVLIIEKFMF